MESPAVKIDDDLTPAQRRAVAARGNVLVVAGAGTGKTHTLVERCLDCLCREQASLDEILVVTFTEAAATEMRQRLRAALESLLDPRRAAPNARLAAQLALFDAAHIGTLHSFCLKLVSAHFYELGLDPQPAVLDEGEARLLADETLEAELQLHYAGENELSPAVQKLIQIYGGGRDERIRSLVLRLHHYAQTRPDAEGWRTRQLENFLSPEPDEWRMWLSDAVRDWCDEWLPVLEDLKSQNEKAVELARFLSGLAHPGDSQIMPGNRKPGGAGILPVRCDPPARRQDAGAPEFSRERAAELLDQIISADADWPTRKKIALRDPLESLFAEAAFLYSLAAVKNGTDPLTEDWEWVRGHMAALLRLTQNFSARYAARKRDDGVVDFHDLEQFALKLLWDFAADRPTPAAEHWREKIRFVFVDEYQDINAAQDKIIQALSRDDGWGETPGGLLKANALQSTDGSRGRPPHPGNRFLVGDAKQSIYRFRLADPKIFRAYAGSWRGQAGQTIPLSENFRSRESLLHFVNSVFGLLMREDVGGIRYEAEAQLQFGARETRAAPGLSRNSTPHAELRLRLKKGARGEATPGNESRADGLDDLEESEKEARLLAMRLKELKETRHKIQDGKQPTFRPVEWRDMAVLLRSPANKAEAYAKEFERAGVPLVVARGGFYDSSEILDLLSLLQLLDNPLQDVPCLAVLRSPLAGLSLAELAEIRLAARNVHFWTALDRTRSAESGARNELRRKIENFLERFSRWRKMARQASLSQCLEGILAETHYADWLQSRPRGPLRQANVQRLLNLTRRFDQFQRQGLFRFLKFIEAQREAGVEPEVAAIADEDAVRLMSIHQSKGLEFPVVAVADLAKPFNLQDLRAEIILDERFGLCPRVKPPHTGRRYPSLPHWRAQRHEQRELLGEELRLLYVAMTRARDTLILSGSITQKKWDDLWTKPATVTSRQILAAKCCADWLGLWFAQNMTGANAETTEGELPNLRWRIADDAELPDKSAIGHRPSAMDLPVLDDATATRLNAMLSREYPHTAATNRAAKSSVTALRRQAEEADEEAEQLFAGRSFRHPGRRGPADRTSELPATATGLAHHKFLQHLALENADDLAALQTEATRLEREKVLAADERAALDLKAVAAFWNSPPGKKIRARAADVRRELAFTAKFSPPELAEITGITAAAGLENEFVVVQGVADLAVLLPTEIWLVDFKTDDVRGDELPARAKNYEPQLKLYARALSRIYSRPVTNCWLHFLPARRTVDASI